jgi:FlaG protein
MKLTPIEMGASDAISAQARAERAQQARNRAEYVPVTAAEPVGADWPPPEVWREVDHAGRVWESLHAQGRELHFDLDADSGDVTIQVRDLDGNVLRTIPPSEAASIAANGQV